MEHIQQRDGRWCIVDLVGKHGRVRTVPMSVDRESRVQSADDLTRPQMWSAALPAATLGITQQGAIQ